MNKCESLHSWISLGTKLMSSNEKVVCVLLVHLGCNFDSEVIKDAVRYSVAESVWP